MSPRPRLRSRSRAGSRVVREIRFKPHQVFKTVQCFTDDDGHNMLQSVRIDDSAVEAACAGAGDREEEFRTEATEIEQMKACLRMEYIRNVNLTDGTDDPADNPRPLTANAGCDKRQYDHLVVRAVVRRLQLTCGLTTKMKYSFAGDSIIVVVRADEGDLRTEAARIGYKMQLYNQPFKHVIEEPQGPLSSHHEPQTGALPGPVISACRQMLRQNCGPNVANVEPMIDPAMLRDGRQPRLMKHLARHGHKEENAHATVPGGDLGTYISPFAEYNIEDKYQPLYRRWDLGDIVAASAGSFLASGNQLQHGSKRGGRRSPMSPKAKRDASRSPVSATIRPSVRLAATRLMGRSSIFRPIDRIRLLNSIIERHINIEALKYRKLLTHSFGLHDSVELDVVMRSWGMKPLDASVSDDVANKQKPPEKKGPFLDGTKTTADANP
eukprot:g418.t1